MRALDGLGVGEAVAARGVAATRSAILTSDGRELTRVPSDLLEGTIALHRADLQAELAAATDDLRLGVEITAVEQGEDGVVARSSDGSEERGDLLVGADGLSSVVRRAIADVPICYAGYAAWRGVSSVPVETGAPDRIVGRRRALRAGRHRSWANVLVRDQECAGGRARRARRQESGNTAALRRLARADRGGRRGGRREHHSPQRRLLPGAARLLE
jgi:2-polyprenyl-6-methoxyphenol hydroxylase-like FAD-dependent oxidoreductase